MNFLECGNLVDVHIKHNSVSVIAMFKIQNVLFPEIMNISHFPLTERNKYKFRVNANFVPHSFFFFFFLSSFSIIILKQKNNTWKITWIMYLKAPTFIHRVHTLWLTYFKSMFPFYTPENVRKPEVFWCFQGA